jgi:FkbM family methyltransferase
MLRTLIRNIIPQNVRLQIKDFLGLPRWLHDDYAALRVIPPGLENHFVFDIGACEGWFTTCWLHYNPRAKVICFEPSPDTFSTLLAKNLANEHRVILENVGVGSKNEVRHIKEFDYYKANSFLEPVGSFKLSPSQDSSARAVRIIRLDNYIKEHHIDHIMLMKIDVQGFEEKVLNGMGEYMSIVDFFYIEASIHPLYNINSTFCNIFRSLTNSGFLLMDIQAHAYGTGFLRECNMLFGNSKKLKTTALILT